MTSLLLADYGADVIKIEGPERPDGERRTAPLTKDGESYRFGMLNRNKRALTVDLKSNAGREAMLRLTDTADVVIEGFRPGTVDRLGIDYATVSKRNPRIVYCSLSGYGQYGPYSMVPGHDLNYLAAAGMTSYVGTPTDSPDQPLRPPTLPIADVGGGTLMAVFGILAALVRRQSTANGDYVDVSMYDGTFFWHNVRGHLFLPDTSDLDSVDVSGANAVPGYAIYAAGDGKLLTLGCVEAAFWNNLRRALGLEDGLPALQPSGPGAARARQLIATRLRDHDRDTWLATFDRHDVPASAVRSTSELFDDPHVKARELMLEVDLGDGVDRHLGFPVKMRHGRPALRRAAPRCGQHTDEILQEIGYSVPEIAALRAQGVVR